MGSKINSVIVLMPNGRRQTLKINLDDSVLQILEDVCKKHGYNYEEFSLRHHNTILDPTSVIRYSGLPNNAFLEMVTSHKPSIVGGKVMLSLHIEGNSERLTGEFPSDSTLEVILSALSPSVIDSSSDKVPVVIYMRKEIVGVEAFRLTTLRNLGLTSGRALLRVITRDSEAHPELKSTGVSVLAKKEGPGEKSVRESEARSSTDSSKQPFCLSSKRPTFESQTIPAAEIVTAVEIVHDVLKEARLNEDTYKQPQTSAHVQKEERPSSSGIQVQKRSHSPGRKLANTVPMEVDTVKQSKVDVPEINLDDVSFLEERNGLVFTIQTSSMSLCNEVPDSFFDVTVDDVKVLMKHLQQSRQEMENAPLQTEALRKLDQERRMKYYKNTIIRIQFPDRLVLQGVFDSNETVNDVIKFVKKYIQDPNVDFYLYTSPPKVVLNDSDLLINIGCVPCGKMYFAYSNQTVSTEQFLHNKVEPYMTSHRIATYVACHLRGVENDSQFGGVINIPESCKPADVKPEAPTQGGSLQETQRSSTVDPKKSGSVPKWFKPQTK